MLQRSALHWSAAFNNVECIRLLLKHSSNVALQDSEGKTPLHWAANNHDPNAVACIKALLVSSNANRFQFFGFLMPSVLTKKLRC